MRISITSSFNSRAHKGRDRIISAGLMIARCFNSRAHKGRDRRITVDTDVVREFQFTRPQGARPYSLVEISALHPVSIHAPTRGATISKQDKEWTKLGFNSRAHKGRDHTIDNNNATNIKFQFTRPQGARPMRAMRLLALIAFQFTRPQGARPDALVASLYQ